jgi:hypothetical protein
MQLSLPKVTGKSGKAAVSRGIAAKRRPAFAAVLSMLILIGCFAPVFAFNQPVPAPGISRMVLGAVETKNFPLLSFTLELFNSEGSFITDLQPAQLAIYEDRAPLPAEKAELSPRGVQFTLAINASPALGAQVNGIEQLSAIRRSLMDWCAAQSPSFGDFSLAGNTGLQLIRSRSPADCSDSLDDFRPELAKAESGLFALTTALDLASEQGDPALWKPAVLFITAPMNVNETAGLGNQAARAAQRGVPVFIWLVVPDPNAAQPAPIPGLADLQSVADVTGGKLALVSAATGFPSLADWLEPLRNIYRITYNSGIRTGGEHTISVQVIRPDLTLSTAREIRFDLDVLAPNPIFVNPPTRLERIWIEADRGEDAVLSPASVELETLVEYPDGYPRPLRAARLFVNDVLVAENTTAPFERFSWDISAFQSAAQVILRVEVEDMLGLKGATIASPVDLVVAPPPERGLFARITPQGLVAVGAVLLAGAILVVILVGESRQHARRGERTSHRRHDPVTQPVQITQEPPVQRQPRRAAVPSPSWPRGGMQAPAPARLLRLSENEIPISGSQIPVNRPELTFGSDPRKAVVSLADGSVCALHARLLRTREGGFVIEDEGSIAGTWVNYVPVGRPGMRLNHGDLIHIGRVMLRFELAEAPQLSAPVIRLVDEEP